MWNTGHYQFFPFVFLMFAVFLRGIFGNLSEQEEEPRPAVALTLITVFIFVLVFGNLLYSGFLGAIAFILGIVIMIYCRFGSYGLKSSAPVIALLILVVPLPLQMDQHLITKMQLWASKYARLCLKTLIPENPTGRSVVKSGRSSTTCPLKGSFSQASRNALPLGDIL